MPSNALWKNRTGSDLKSGTVTIQNDNQAEKAGAPKKDVKVK